MTHAEALPAASIRARALWPTATAVALYLALIAVLIWIGLSFTRGAFVYTQDDPYIHLTIARTLAEHGVWGISATEFAGASSSLLWTLLLAGLWKAGLHALWLPVVLNVGAGIALLVFVDRMLQVALAPKWRAAVLAAIVLVSHLICIALFWFFV
jgi:hypothetical protein